MNWYVILQMVVAVFGGGGIIVGAVALLKVRPEAGQIVVTAAEGAVVVQSAVIEDLRKEIERLRHDNDMLRQEIAKLRKEIESLSKHKQS